jgi:hypothetical protein
MAVSIERAESARELLNPAARIEEHATGILDATLPPLTKDELEVVYVAGVRLQGRSAAECEGEAILAALSVLAGGRTPR